MDQFDRDYDGASFVQRQVTYTFFTPHSASCLETEAEKCNDLDQRRIMEEMADAVVVTKMLGLPIVSVETHSKMVDDPVDYETAKKLTVEAARRMQFAIDAAGFGENAEVSTTETPGIKIVNADDISDDDIMREFFGSGGK